MLKAMTYGSDPKGHYEKQDDSRAERKPEDVGAQPVGTKLKDGSVCAVGRHDGALLSPRRGHIVSKQAV